MDLRHTIRLMTSDDYKDRFVAEYLQLKERYTRLKRYVHRIRAAQLMCKEEPKHDCPIGLLTAQLNNMDEYMKTLELRAIIENIDLDADPEELLRCHESE